MGKTLGGKYTHWRRAKRLLPNRYRLFFRVHSPDQVIIIAWLNDGTTLRKKGDKKDVYEVFKHMLKVGDIANDIQELKKQAQKPPM
jgi:toxin YhaV